MLLLSRSPLDMTPTEQEEALLYLMCKLAYKEGSFTLTSGRQSDYYINCKPVLLHPQGSYLVGQQMMAMLPPTTEAVAGMTLGADPIVSSVSLASVYQTPPTLLQNIPAIIVRKQPKGHGTQAWLEGLTLAPLTRVWILEDVVTTGGSALQAAERVQAAGYRVEGVLSLVDREEGGEACYRDAGIQFQRVFTIGRIREFYRGVG